MSPRMPDAEVEHLRVVVADTRPEFGHTPTDLERITGDSSDRLGLRRRALLPCTALPVRPRSRAERLLLRRRQERIAERNRHGRSENARRRDDRVDRVLVEHAASVDGQVVVMS